MQTQLQTLSLLLLPLKRQEVLLKRVLVMA
jgi:hypothetical protein